MMKTVWERLVDAEKPVLLYGTGNGADKIIDELERLGVKLSGVFASDGFVRKRVFRGFQVMSYSEACEAFGDFIVLVSFGSSRAEVIENIVRISEHHELYSVDVPVYGDAIFNRDFYNEHKDDIENVRKHLSDEKSLEVFDNIINFKLTGNISLLLDCQTDRDEAYENILKLSDDETYLDLGAFNGDTVDEFLCHVKAYDSIIAVEPDGKNFRKLENNTSDVKNIRLLNCCVSDTDSEINFSSDGGRNGTADEKGTLIRSMTVDSICKDKNVTYIKFDVEGLEKKAISGAENTIRTQKPKMLVSCYHRSEDIFALALQVLALRSDYKVYIRHNPYIPAWDTQFYFI